MTTVSVEEQESIRQSARAFVRERAPVSHFRELRDTKDPLGFSLDLWLDMAKLGFAGLVLPATYGGAGLGYAELGIVAEELGRNLVPTPVVANVLGAGVVLLAGTDVLRKEVLPGVCTGERVIGLAGDEGMRFAPYAVATRAEKRGSGFVLHGEKSFVLDGQKTEEVGGMLDQEGIAVRSGHHCAQPILRRFGLEATVRASLAPYNTCEDIDALVAALHRIQVGRPVRK